MLLCDLAGGELIRLAPTACEWLALWEWRLSHEMTYGDWAGWAQFFGAMLTLLITYRLASRDGRIRREDAELERQEIAKQRVINYEIATDTFRNIVAERHIAVIEVAVTQTSDKYFATKPLEYLDANLRIMDRLVLDRLPNERCAIDVQMMRQYAYASRAAIESAQAQYRNTSWNVLIPEMLADLEKQIHYAYLPRNDDGPIDRIDSDEHARWKASNPPDLKNIESLYISFEVPRRQNI